MTITLGAAADVGGQQIALSLAPGTTTNNVTTSPTPPAKIDPAIILLILNSQEINE